MKLRPIVQRFSIYVPDRVQRATADGQGLERVDGEELERQVEVSIDMDYIVHRLGLRAVRNKSGQAVLGPILVTHKKVRLKFDRPNEEEHHA